MDRKVNRLSETKGENQNDWNHPFNQLLIVNYDINADLIVNRDIIVPAAISITDNVGPKVTPSIFEISHNANEVNNSMFTFDVGGSTTAHYALTWTEYA
jgi:hypothetical protein